MHEQSFRSAQLRWLGVSTACAAAHAVLTCRLRSAHWFAPLLRVALVEVDSTSCSCCYYVLFGRHHHTHASLMGRGHAMGAPSCAIGYTDRIVRVLLMSCACGQPPRRPCGSFVRKMRGIERFSCEFFFQRVRAQREGRRHAHLRIKLPPVSR